MAKTNMSNVNWLSIHEVAVNWAPQLQMDQSIVERELRIAFYKLEHDYPFHEPINVNPDVLDLPSPETLIDRDFIENFHGKELWKLPDFWSKGLPTSGKPGRPTNAPEVIAELRRRDARGERQNALAAETRALCAWEQSRFRAELHHSQKGMENAIRMAFNALKRDGPAPH